MYHKTFKLLKALPLFKDMKTDDTDSKIMPILMTQVINAKSFCQHAHSLSNRLHYSGVVVTSISSYYNAALRRTQI